MNTKPAWPLHLRECPKELHQALDEAKFKLMAIHKKKVTKEQVALQILKDRLLPKKETPT